MKDEAKKFHITNSNGPAYKFTGRLIGHHSTNPHGDKANWQETKLYESVGGAWIAELIGETTVRGQHKITTVSLIPAEGDEFERRCAVMEALDWSPCARAMAKAMGWPAFVVEVA